MKWLKSIFKKKKTIPQMPPYDEIVESLYGQNPVYDSLKICEVIYSKDHSKRFLLLESDKGFFKYSYEEVCVLDEFDWNSYYCYIENVKPGWWETKDRAFGYSFFGTAEEAMTALKCEPEYKQFFE